MMSSCNVCGISNTYFVTLSGEPLRLCAGCGNVQSTPDPHGRHSGWKRHGVKLTASRQFEEVESRRRQAVTDLDRTLSAMAAHEARFTRERKAANDVEQTLRARLAENERIRKVSPSRRTEVMEMKYQLLNRRATAMTTAALEADLVQERAATARLREALIAEQAQRAAAEAVAEDAYRKYRTSVAKARWKMAAAGTGVHDNTLQKSPSKTSSSSSSRREGMRKPGSLQTRCEELEGQVAELRATLQAEREKKAAELKTCFEYIEELEER